MLEIEIEDELERFFIEFFFKRRRHSGDFSIADGVESEAFLHLSRFHFAHESDRPNLAADFNKKPNC